MVVSIRKKRLNERLNDSRCLLDKNFHWEKQFFSFVEQLYL